MSRKASNTLEYFVPYDDIREDVLKHKLQDLFGSKATFADDLSGDGWLVRRCSRIPKDPIKTLKSDTVLVDNALREREKQDGARLQREASRAYPDLSTYGKTGGIRPPIRPETQRHEDDDETYDRGASRYVDGSVPHRPFPNRHSSIVGRPGDTIRPISYSNTLPAPVLPTQYNVQRRDGHSPRSSSLLLGSSPRDTPQVATRHNASQDLMRDTIRDPTDAINDLSRSATRDRNASYSSYGQISVQTAARDTKRDYVEDDFPTIIEWRQYNRERAQYQAQIREMESYKKGSRAEESDEYADEDEPGGWRSQQQSSQALKQTTRVSRRHQETYDQEAFGKVPRLPVVRHQTVNAPATRDVYDPDARHQKARSSQPRDVYDPEARHQTARASQSEDVYAPEVRFVDGRESPDTDDDIIGRKAMLPSTKTGDGRDRSQNSKEQPELNPKKYIKPMSETKSRHDTEKQSERTKTAATQTAIVKISSKDQGKASGKSTSKSVSRHHKETRDSRLAVERTKPYHGDDRSSTHCSGSDEDVNVRSQSNSKRPRDPEYNARPRRK